MMMNLSKIAKNIIKENFDYESQTIEKGLQILKLLNKVDDDGLDQIASFMGIYSDNKEDQFDKMKEWLDNAPLKEIDKLYLELQGAIGGSEFLEKSNLKENITDDKERFEEIINEMKDLVKEAYSLVPQELKPRAKAYWYGHIVSSIDDDHGFMGGGGHTMQDTLEEFDEEESDEEEFDT